MLHRTRRKSQLQSLTNSEMIGLRGLSLFANGSGASLRDARDDGMLVCSRMGVGESRSIHHRRGEVRLAVATVIEWQPRRLRCSDPPALRGRSGAARRAAPGRSGGRIRVSAAILYRHRLHGYLAEQVPSICLASSFSMQT